MRPLVSSSIFSKDYKVRKGAALRENLCQAEPGQNYQADGFVSAAAVDLKDWLSSMEERVGLYQLGLDLVQWQDADGLAQLEVENSLAKTVSVAVSVLTLTFISVDRWYAICFPLKFKSTTGRAKTAILLIWLVALAIDIPELLALQTHSPELRVSSHLLTQCAPNWTTETEIIFLCVKVVLLYSLPLLLMSVAYWQIVRVLWRSDAIPGQSEVSSSSTTLASGGSSMSEYKPVIY
ncbi:Hypothetical predicted protein [Cloeon dipterum]|uniref:G-protein coupled receptors family 1 profile domain-containing protein n=1 Tax=Cloeon dipterum TaxID=197152 RepID=A0A8S1E972_9INSE|nr:Hypothetical predicted protein [Cloeon dipterum]